ncbi:phage major capsid protein [Actinospongicola halichondriae]|uniref:phage major capsid protein n=1 Tax=Actinospongicola halichondriae TaxID=3236844 RepID=UPI003D49F10E
MQAIVDGADERSMTDEEVADYEALETELESVRKSEEIRSRQAAYSHPTPESLGLPTFNIGKANDGDDLERAFDDYLRTGKENADLMELRAQSTTGSAGGYTVPSTFRSKLVDVRSRFAGIANHVDTFNTADGRPVTYPTINDTANAGQIVAENGSASGGADMVFGEVTLGSFKYMAPGAGAAPLAVSVELLQDSEFDIAGLVANKLGQRVARQQAEHFVNGAGTTEPVGITDPTSVAFDLTHSDLIDAIHSVDPDYRENAVWAFNDATLAEIRKLVDDNNRPLWQPEATSGIGTLPGGMLLGFPVVIDQAFSDGPNTATPVDNWGVFGDIKEGFVVRRIGSPSIIADPYTGASVGQVRYTIWDRADSNVQNASAYTVLGI